MEDHLETQSSPNNQEHVDIEQLEAKKTKRKFLIIRTSFALAWSLVTFFLERNRLFEFRYLYQYSLSMFTLFLLLDAPVVGYYIHSGISLKLNSKEESDDTALNKLIAILKDMVNNITALSLVWNLAVDGAIYMFFVCALCGVY